MSATADTLAVTVPDIGDFSDVPVIEILVSPGDTVAVDDPLVTLESDKATMDVPAPAAGVVKTIHVSIGDSVSEGSLLMDLEAAGGSSAGDSASASGATGAISAEAESPAATPSGAGGRAPTPGPPATAADARAGDVDNAAIARSAPAAGSTPPAVARNAPSAAVAAPSQQNGSGPVYASPAVRRLARELGIDLHVVRGSGRKGRVTPDDVRNAKASGGARAAGGVGVAGLDLAPWPSVDFEKLGPVERVERTRIQKISAPNLARNWVMIPHVTQHDEADITELEAWRKQLNAEHDKDGVKVTLLAFLVVACVASLKEFPTFNSALDGDDLVLRRYYNIGFAADTPNGLVVPVITDADAKGVLEIAAELGELAAKARDGKLSPGEISGSTFTISSLGGIGGTAFTPIINAPEVAILGVSRSTIKPVWDDASESFVPRLMVPLSLSYDHRVIDGASAARFVVHLAKLISDLRRALL